MRIKIIQSITADEIDGIDLRRFLPGQKYDVGHRLAAVLLAEGWAEPMDDDEPAVAAPFSESDPFMSRVMDRSSPPNLVRETYPPYADDIAVAHDLERRTRSRKNEK